MLTRGLREFSVFILPIEFRHRGDLFKISEGKSREFPERPAHLDSTPQVAE
jgi:hypothetical protein